LIFEFCGGGTLEELLAKKKNISEFQALEYFK
jgi:hypothetical protein